MTLFGEQLDIGHVVRYLVALALMSELHWFTLYPVEFNVPLWSIGMEVSSYVLLATCLVGLFKARLNGWPARLLWCGIIGFFLVAQWQIVSHVNIDDLEPGRAFGRASVAKAILVMFNPIAFFVMNALGALAAGIQTMLATYRSLAFDAAVLVGLALDHRAVERWYSSGIGLGLFHIPYGFPWFQLGVALILVAIPGSVLVGRIGESAPIAFIAKSLSGCTSGITCSWRSPTAPWSRTTTSMK